MRLARPILRSKAIAFFELSPGTQACGVVRWSSTEDKLARDRQKIGRSDWENLWKHQITPWDLGTSTPVLSDELAKHRVLPGATCLVPGCGSGHDLVPLVTELNDAHVIGLEIASGSLTAIRDVTLPRANLRENVPHPTTGSKVELLQADFFKFDPSKKFDFIFDYTFFCALHPSMRNAWAIRMAELLAPGGKLLTLIFPIDEKEASNPDADGPPYPVSFAEYSKVLGPAGLELIETYESPATIKPRQGRESVAWWKKPH